MGSLDHECPFFRFLCPLTSHFFAYTDVHDGGVYDSGESIHDLPHLDVVYENHSGNQGYNPQPLRSTSP